jgi:quercetin dioxygenase-like cupin family protein
MKTNRRLNNVALALSVCAVILFCVTAYALTNTTLAKGTLAFSPIFDGPADVVMAKVTIEPGESSAWHYHTGPVYVVVTKGTITEEDGCGPTEVFTTGQAFQEGPLRVHRVRNYGTEQVELYVTYIVPSGSPTTVRLSGPLCGPPTSIDQCKDDGWINFNHPRSFSNQGECVQYVMTSK